MSQRLLKSHEVFVKNGKKFVKEHFTVRVRSGDENALVVQEGFLFYDNGTKHEGPIPDWFWKEYDKFSDRVKEKLMLNPPPAKKV